MKEISINIPMQVILPKNIDEKTYQNVPNHKKIQNYLFDLN